MSGTEGVMAVSIEEWNAKTTENEFLRTEIARLQNDVVRELRQVLEQLQHNLEQLTNEVMEQARLNGMGGERELGLRAEIATLMTLLKAASYHVEGDGDGGAALLAKIRAALKDKP